MRTEQRVVGTRGLLCGRKLENKFHKQKPGDSFADCGYWEHLIDLET